MRGCAVLIFAYAILLEVVGAATFCYECHGTNETTGVSCSVDDVCFGSNCVFVLNENGTWKSDCLEKITVPSSITLSNSTCSLGTNQVYCSCQNNFCNRPVSFARQIGALGVGYKAFSTKISKVTCFECGTVAAVDVGLGNSSLVIPCDGTKTCTGTACVTRRSVRPRSFCATEWFKSPDGCVKAAGEDELCSCSQTMCNWPYDPLDYVADDDVTTTQQPPALPTTTKAPVTFPNGTILCPNGKHYGPNEQAVFMGKKLKSRIMGNFGPALGTDAVNEFKGGIDYHICNYNS